MNFFLLIPLRKINWSTYLCTNLVSALSSLQMYDLPHFEASSVSNVRGKGEKKWAKQLIPRENEERERKERWQSLRSNEYALYTMCVEARVAGSATRERVQRTKCNRVSRRSAPAVWWSLRGGAKLARKRSRVGVLRSTLHSVTRRASGLAARDSWRGRRFSKRVCTSHESIGRTTTDQQPISYRLSVNDTYFLNPSIQKRNNKSSFPFFRLIFFSYIYICIYIYTRFFVPCPLYIFIWVCPRRTERSICHLSLGKVSWCRYVCARKKTHEARTGYPVRWTWRASTGNVTRSRGCFSGLCARQSNELYFRSPRVRICSSHKFRAWYEIKVLNKRKGEKKEEKRDWGDHFVRVSHC